MNTNANARTAERRGESGRMRGVLHDAEKSGKSGARDAKKGRRGASCFGLRDTSQGLTQPLLDPPTGQLSPLSPSRVSGSFSVAATPSGPAVTLASTTISTGRGRRYSVSVLVEPPTPTQR